MTSATHWELHDWLTGELVAHGDNPAGLRAALAGVCHADSMYDEIPEPDTADTGLPPSLSRALEEWVCDPATPDEDIAQIAGWPVAKVRDHR
ncbi:hypothetical protein JIG36_01700 [Actinoplanes sp. LDG1-06]|uniref:Uncharacterized protein n=1 Tax=Paractinoplanes ovalisporus TaxID=2810368 RepID=A0ABS2A342_9ACTN|nr:hypothetical protein [Actinoplanes ovalisporus]MBM2614268.1 hypothetical protein [Actinoplanes ovalisporus]